MSTYIVSLDVVHERDRVRVGDKFYALSRASGAGLHVPEALCVTTDAYRRFIDEADLDTAISNELARKRFEDMRWEELWDAALRIRARFARAAFPQALAAIIDEAVTHSFADKPVVVRSSAPGEDTAETSFAGIHESFVNVIGARAVIEHIKLVWATLFSDKALLYRKELGLDPRTSSMAVIVQRMVASDRSGIAFTVSPTDNTRSIIEAVYGLNQGLVDGLIEPDRWILDRETGAIAQRSMAKHDIKLVPKAAGVAQTNIPESEATEPVLDEDGVSRVFDLAMKAERYAGAPQDVEWSFERERLYTLQSRPITTGSADDDDPRRMYLNLHRSYDDLVRLRADIEERVLPGMEADAKRLAGDNLHVFDDAALADALETRKACYQRWKDEYWDICIPFAHGMRLLGTFYNDAVHPEDPHEFIELIKKHRTRDDLERAFFEVVPEDQRDFAQGLLELGRDSFRLRDVDNSYLDKVEDELGRAIEETRKRLINEARMADGILESDEAIAALRDPAHRPVVKDNEQRQTRSTRFRARQLIGQPAGKGIVQGRARVILSNDDIVSIGEGEVVVCDAIDPAMTAAVSRASGIVERRGGMLIHGAIIAREYGLPCVTGIPDATTYIETGDLITVDGDLGIVTISIKA